MWTASKNVPLMAAAVVGHGSVGPSPSPTTSAPFLGYAGESSPPTTASTHPDWIAKRTTYEKTEGRCPPYLVYLDHDHGEIVVAIRGLNPRQRERLPYFAETTGWACNQMFDGGFVRHGLLLAATWLLDRENEALSSLWLEPIDFSGHSLGSGVPTLVAILSLSRGDIYRGIPKSLVRAHAVAPARCVSLKSAIK